VTGQVIAGNTLSSLNALFQKHLAASEQPQPLNMHPDFLSLLQASIGYRQLLVLNGDTAMRFPNFVVLAILTYPI
jgi:hypothetical protein